MSGLARRLMAGAGAVDKFWVDDVFSVRLYTGNGSTQTINNGIDLAGNGGMVWVKDRNYFFNNVNSASFNSLTYSNLLNTNFLKSDSADGKVSSSSFITAFTSVGFNTAGADAINKSSDPFVSWTFRNADKFYGHQVVTKSAGSNATVNFVNLGTLGMVRVKRTDSAGSWYVWHRSLSAGQLLIGETTAAAATLGHVTVSDTTVTLVNGVISDGAYLVEAFAHDTSADGIIQCGSYVGNSSSLSVTLGWEPQFILVKKAATGVGATNWLIADSMRGLITGIAADPLLYPNTSGAEDNGYANVLAANATGFTVETGTSPVNDLGITHIYLAIRRPNKPPTTGTQVYNAIAMQGTSTVVTVNAGFAVDMSMSRARAGNPTFVLSRPVSTGDSSYNILALNTTSTSAESSMPSAAKLDSSNGLILGTNVNFNDSSLAYVHHFFRRAPGFFDVVCYTGGGQISHSLNAFPELIIVKGRNEAKNWYCCWFKPEYSPSLTLFKNGLSLNASSGGLYNGSDSTFGVGISKTFFTPAYIKNISGESPTAATNYVTYLFASLAGISKVGSYTGNGSSQTIDCGFTTGARFVLIKRTDSTGDWYVWDTARGIVAANDPHLSLNTTAAEVTTDDSIDPDASGFIVNQNAATNINVNLASYIFLAIA